MISTIDIYRAYQRFFLGDIYWAYRRSFLGDNCYGYLTGILEVFSGLYILWISNGYIRGFF